MYLRMGKKVPTQLNCTEENVGDEGGGVTEARSCGLLGRGQTPGFSSKWSVKSLNDLKKGSDKINFHLSNITLPTLWRLVYRKMSGRRCVKSVTSASIHLLPRDTWGHGSVTPLGGAEVCPWMFLWRLEGQILSLLLGFEL